MVIIWTLMEILFLIFFFQLPPVGEEEDQKEQELQLLTKQQQQSHQYTFQQESGSCFDKLLRLGWLISQLVYEEIVTLLTVLFFSQFAEYVLEVHCNTKCNVITI